MNSSFVRYRLFDSFPEVHAFTTTRQSLRAYEAPRFTGRTENRILRKKLATILNIDCTNLVFPQQIHSGYVTEILSLPAEDPEETDALVTNMPGICLCIQTADCVPLLLYDPVKKAVAAIHAGWRGTVGLIARETVRKMVASYASDPASILAVMGPSIGPDVYEVGRSVVEAAWENLPGASKAIRKNSSGKLHFDLWEANRQVLLASGLKPENVDPLGECTYTLQEHYFSARREGIETGRLVSGIMLAG